jgi:uncharacterized repeat protein (TIGR04138 family)
MATNSPEKTVQQIAETVGTYPVEAYLFVQDGLSYTVQKMHRKEADPETGEKGSRHISGRELCLGLREKAWHDWGLLARTVLQRWNITTTLDFGRIVFALVEHNHLQKTDEDTLADFRQVYDFRTALETEYRIGGCAPSARRAESAL